METIIFFKCTAPPSSAILANNGNQLHSLRHTTHMETLFTKCKRRELISHRAVTILVICDQHVFADVFRVICQR
eukprot:12589286-Ditylum_brightwellii.AAC.1